MLLGGLQEAAGLDASTKSGQAQKKMEEDLNQFLNLLVTQLQNQDPLEPLDANEFTAQLVQFASVEQQIYQNSNLEKILGMQQSSQTASMVSYLGTTIEAKGQMLPLENSQAKFTYEIGLEVQETTITIQDDTGRTVFTTTGEHDAGKHGGIWDGKDSSGTQVPDGIYSLTVTAKGRDGTLKDVQHTTFGTVTGASAADGNVRLSMGNANVLMDDVIKVEK